MEIVFDKVSYIINESTSLEKTILNNVSFSITKGGVYSFIGASNSGKSVIGALISMTVYPSSGKVTISSYLSNGRSKSIKKLRSKIGYVSKNPYDMFFNKTVYKELVFGLNNFKYKKESSYKRVIDSLKLVGLSEDILETDPLSLDLVRAKKLALACTLIYNPKVIILDEFTNGMPSYEKKELVRLIRILKNKYNKTIILLTKDTSFAYEITDYVYLMYLTRLVAFGKREILEDSELLKNLKLEVPKIVSFVDACNKKGHDINHYNNILDLIKGVYRDVY